MVCVVEGELGLTRQIFLLWLGKEGALEEGTRKVEEGGGEEGLSSSSEESVIDKDSSVEVCLEEEVEAT